jgi:hypothetical protein
MKKFTSITHLICLLILGFAMSLQVIAQSQVIASSPGKTYPGIHQHAFNPYHPLPVSGNDQPFHKSTLGSFPCETHHYYWDVTTIWMADYNRYCTYDNHGNVLTNLKTDTNTGDTLELTTYTYDSEQRLIKRIFQIWNNGNWENSEQNYYEFDTYGNETISLYYFWQGSWVPAWGTKHIYTYENNKMIEDLSQEWDQILTTWVNASKYIYTYDVNGYRTEHVYQYWESTMGVWISAFKDNYLVGASGIVNEVIMQEWDDLNSTWVNYLKNTNIVWHQWNGDFYSSDLENMTVLLWTNGIWENYYRLACAWEANGSYEETQQQYSNGNWINTQRIINAFDDHGNFILFTYEFWTNNNWVIDMGSQYLLTYNGNDMTQRITQEWDHFMNEWVNYYKEEYSDFFQTQGMIDNPYTLNGIHLYPNPSTGIIRLEPDTPDAGNIAVEIMNTNGQVIYTNQFQISGKEMIEIDLTGCAKGIYFVKLQLERETSIGKLILQ